MLARFWLKAVFFIIVITNSVAVFAKEYKGTSEYYIADISTKNIAIEFARDMAKQSALEQAGTFVSSLSESSKGMLTKDDVKSVTLGFAKLKHGTEETKYSEPDKDGAIFLSYSAVFDIDDKEVADNLKKYQQDSQKISELKSKLQIQKLSFEQLEQRYKELQTKFKALNSDQEKHNYQTEIAEVQNGLNALEYLKIAFDYQENRDFENALTYYDKVLDVYPDYVQKTKVKWAQYLLSFILHQKGQIYLATKQLALAEQSFSAASILAPDFFRPYTGLALLYFSTGRKDMAIAAANKAVAIEPNEVTYFYRMVINRALGNWQAACDDFERVQNKGAFASPIGWAYLQLNNYQRAVQVFDMALQQNPNDADAYHGRGRAYCGIGQYQLSIEDFTKAISLAPTDFHAYAERGASYLKLKQYQLALNDSLFALKNNPNDSTALWVLEELKKVNM